MSKKADLTWSADGLIHSFNYYCYESPTTIENLPLPKASGIIETSYTDTDLEDNKRYYFRVGAVRGENEKISDELTFSTGDLLKNWLIDNAIVGDAWFIADAIVDVNNKISSVPPLAGKLSALTPVGSLYKNGLKTNLSPGNYLKMNSGILSDFKFLHILNSYKYIIAAFKIASSKVAYMPILATNNALSGQPGLTLSIDMRSASNPRQNIMATHAMGTSYVNMRVPITENNTVPVDQIAIIEFQGNGSLTPLIRVEGNVISWTDTSRNGTVNTSNNPSGLPTIGSTINGTSFSFDGEFFGLMFCDVEPNEEDRLMIYQEFQKRVTSV